MAFTASKHQSGVLIVEVEGQLIVGNRQELKATIQQALDNGERKLLVDFAKTGYIDSSGLGALVSISKKVREQGGELRLSNFLLWQLAYAELFVTPVLWPDFTRRDFFEAVTEFQRRDRRFGRVPT